MTMRLLIWGWAFPLSSFWAWYGLSFHNISLGLEFMTRRTHDLVFAIYGHILGIDPALLPGMLLQACIFDSFLVIGIVAFRKRRQIKAWWQERQALKSAAPAAIEVGQAHPAE